MKKSMELNSARRLADKIAAELSPFCQLIEVAGSIRRGRPNVNDIDIVALPTDRAGLLARCKEKCVLVKDGNCNFEFALANGVQLDLWLANPERKDLLQTYPTNFGSLLLCRTGSIKHNIYLVTEAEKQGLKWNPYHGVFRGEECLASATEAEIFAALQLSFVPPDRRERP